MTCKACFTLGKPEDRISTADTERLRCWNTANLDTFRSTVCDLLHVRELGQECNYKHTSATSARGAVIDLFRHFEVSGAIHGNLWTERGTKFASAVITDRCRGKVIMWKVQIFRLNEHPFSTSLQFRSENSAWLTYATIRSRAKPTDCSASGFFRDELKINLPASLRCSFPTAQIVLRYSRSDWGRERIAIDFSSRG